jgi:hypothetical protein
MIDCIAKGNARQSHSDGALLTHSNSVSHTAAIEVPVCIIASKFGVSRMTAASSSGSMWVRLCADAGYEGDPARRAAMARH